MAYSFAHTADLVDIACPSCSSRKSKVYETRPSGGERYRARRCLKCSAEFVTVESAISADKAIPDKVRG